jgi:hypothetical protein
MRMPPRYVSRLTSVALVTGRAFAKRALARGDDLEDVIPRTAERREVIHNNFCSRLK